MIERPTLHADLRILSAPGEGVVLVGDDDDVVLRGALFARLIPLLDGRRTTTDLATLLEAEYPPAEVFFALMQLEETGCLGDESGARAAEQVGFAW